MQMYLEFSHDEIQNEIPYQIIAETTSRGIWNTGHRRRLWSQTFSREEQQQLSKIKIQAHKWALISGVPLSGVKMTPGTYELWNRFADFCMDL